MINSKYPKLYLDFGTIIGFPLDGEKNVISAHSLILMASNWGF
jgi:hypothetical protein